MSDEPYAARTPRRRLFASVSVMALLLSAVAGTFVWQVARGTVDARRLLNRGQWSAARQTLSRVLWLFPSDAQARLLMAEAIVRDDSHPALQNANAAITHLQAIPDTSLLAVEARIRQARLTFLLLHQPMMAERLIHEAMRLDSTGLEAPLLLWRILDATGRSDLSEPIFRSLLETAPPRERVVYLRLWYFSQMDPLRAVADLDDAFGFRTTPTDAGSQVELRRLVDFRNHEPDQPVLHAAVARWFQREGDLPQALKVLQECDPINEAKREPFFIAAYASVLIELGQAARAEEVFASWPEPRDSHAFWKLDALLHEERHHNFAAAVISYEKALARWPGAVDWKMQFRLAGCLMVQGDKARAEQVRELAATVRDLFRPETQQRLRRALEHPEQPESLNEIVTFYRTLARDEDAIHWREAIDARSR